MKKIIINASTCTVGGGAVVAANIILGSLGDRSFVFSYILSPLVKKHLDALGVFIDSIVVQKPSHPIVGRNSRKSIKSYIRKIEPDLIFTVFGPAYINSGNIPHLIGFADPWVTHANFHAFSTLNFVQLLKTLSRIAFKRRSLPKSSSAYFWVESEAARSGLVSNCGILPSRISLIPNTCSDIFLGKLNYFRTIDNVKLLSIGMIGAYYPHKNFEVLFEALSILKKARTDLAFKIHLTISEGLPSKSKIYKFITNPPAYVTIENHGSVSLVELKSIYEMCDLVVHPSVLESYSATYPESIWMNKPLIASDLFFARAICHEAAIYFTPRSARDLAQQMTKVIDSPDVQSDLFRARVQVSKGFLSSSERYKCFSHLFASILE